MKPMMRMAATAKRMAHQRELCKAMRVGRPAAEMWLTNCLNKIKLQVLGLDGAIECHWSGPINSVVLEPSGTMTVFSYLDNGPIIDVPRVRENPWYAARENARRVK